MYYATWSKSCCIRSTEYPTGVKPEARRKAIGVEEHKDGAIITIFPSQIFNISLHYLVEVPMAKRSSKIHVPN